MLLANHFLYFIIGKYDNELFLLGWGIRFFQVVNVFPTVVVQYGEKDGVAEELKDFFFAHSGLYFLYFIIGQGIALLDVHLMNA